MMIAGSLTLALSCGGVLAHSDRIALLRRFSKWAQGAVAVPSIMVFPFALFVST